MLSKSLISMLGSNLSGATCHFLPRFSIIIHAVGPILDYKCLENGNPVWLIVKPPKASNTGWVLNPWRMCASSSLSMRNVTEMLLFIAWQSSSSKPSSAPGHNSILCFSTGVKVTYSKIHVSFKCTAWWVFACVYQYLLVTTACIKIQNLSSYPRKFPCSPIPHSSHSNESH